MSRGHRRWTTANGRAAVCITGMLCLVLASTPARAMQSLLDFDELVDRADAIFVGEVAAQTSRLAPNGKMVFTDVRFDNVVIVHERARAKVRLGKQVTLAFAGGALPDKRVKVSDVPVFESGGIYLVFSLMDGRSYASPVVGGFQGLFPVVADEVSGTRHPLTYGRNAIQGLSADARPRVLLGPRVRRIRGGVAEPAAETPDDRRFMVPPTPLGPLSARAAAAPVAAPGPKPGKLMTLEAFTAEIRKRIR